MKYYAVRKGLTPGVYTTWDECQAMVKGYPGAEFKSFPTKEEAEAFVGGTSTNKKETDAKVQVPSVDGPFAYVDGSFCQETGEYSYGVVIVEDPKNPEEVYLNGKDCNEDYASARNVAGEVLASQVAISYAIEHGFKSLVIFHDYEGIGKWANGEWKAKQNLTREYKTFCEDARSRIALDFSHVKGHSGNYYNDVVDTLAKMALGIPAEKKALEEKLQLAMEEEEMDR